MKKHWWNVSAMMWCNLIYCIWASYGWVRPVQLAWHDSGTVVKYSTRFLLQPWTPCVGDVNKQCQRCHCSTVKTLCNYLRACITVYALSYYMTRSELMMIWWHFLLSENNLHASYGAITSTVHVIKLKGNITDYFGLKLFKSCIMLKVVTFIVWL